MKDPNNIIASIRLFYRLLLLIIHLIYATLFLTFFPNNVTKITTKQWQRVQNWHKRLLTICGIKITTTGQVNHHAGLIIANHISWIDIPAISSVLNTGFVAKAEIANWPLIGWFTKKTACIFIHRGKLGVVDAVNKQIHQHINNGLNVLVFPEGTTTDGQSTKRFNSRLFKVAEHQQHPVLLLTLSYPNSPHAIFIGDDSFTNNMINVLKQKQTRVHIDIVEQVEKNLDSKNYAKYCEDTIKQVLHKKNNTL